MNHAILEELQIESGQYELMDLLEEGRSNYVRDNKLNLKSIFKSRHLTEEESVLIALSCAVSTGNKVLAGGLIERGRKADIGADKLADAVACGSLLSVNNVLYRFRHMVGHDQYDKMPAGLRMQIMMNPVMGKELFELASLAVSAINGCESCIKSHESSVLELGSNKDRVFEAVRIASVIRGISTLVI